MKYLSVLGTRGRILSTCLVLSIISSGVISSIQSIEFLLIPSMTVSVVLTIVLLKYFIKKIIYLNDATQQVDNDVLPNFENDVETKGVTSHLESMYHKMQEVVEFVQSMDGKEFNFEYIDREGKVGKILSSLSEKQHNYVEEERKRNWKNEGLAKFGELLRMDEQDLKEMSLKILTNVVNYVEANQAGFFIVEEAEGKRYMELAACYAYDRKKYIESRVEEGQGLLGQVMLEKEILYLTDIPEEYVNITSGLGEGKPNNVVIIPLIVNDHFYGAIELASFQVLETYKVDFLKELAENIAAAVASVKTNENTRKLLEQSQQIGQELQSREEEMRQNMEELEATQEEMSRNEEELNGIFSALNSSQGVAEFDPSRNLLKINELLENTLSFSLEELQVNQRQLLPSEDSAEWKELSNGVSVTMELFLQSKTGEQVWLNADYSAIIDSKGSFKKILMLTTDITDRKGKELEFERLSLVADNTDNSVIITDAKGVTEYVNQGFINLTGYTLEEVVGKSPGEILQGPDTDKETIERISVKVRKGKPLYEEILNYNKSGHSYWISLAINPVFDKSGVIDKFISIQADITKTKEIALDYHYKLEAIGRSNAVIEFDMEGNILEANENFLKIFGYSREEVTGQHHKIFVTDEEANSSKYKDFWKKLADRKYVSDEFKRIDKAGNDVWLKGIYNPIYNLRGEAAKVVKFATDITRERQLQRENLMQTEIKSHLETIDKTIASLEFDMQGKISYVNQVYLDMSNYTREELLGKNYEFLLSSEEIDKPQTQMMWMSLNAGNYFNGQFRQKSKSGKTMWLSGTLNPILDTKGKPVKVMMFALFNTQEREKIQNLTQTVAALKNSSPVIEFSAEGIFKTANEKFFKTFAYERLELRGKSIEFFLDSSMNKKKVDTFLVRLKKNEFLEESLIVMSKEGDKKMVTATFNPILDNERNVVKIIVILVDQKFIATLNSN